MAEGKGSSAEGGRTGGVSLEELKKKIRRIR